MSLTYSFLAIAVIAEVIATSALNVSNQFTRWIPTAIVFVGYGVAFYFESLVLKTMPLGITYAMWAGMGIVLVTIVGAIFFKQIPDLAAMLGIGLIISGVLVINLCSSTVSH
ncbi:DMT family transporter [Pseudomonadota bacterium]